MSHPEPTPPAAAPQPGERQPDAGRRQLSRAPSDRYPARTAVGETDATRPNPSAVRAVGFAVGVAIIGAVILTVILGIFTSTGGTFAITLLASVVIGLRVSTAAVAPGRESRAALGRGAAVRIGSALGVGMLVATGIGVWLLARAEGGVLDPVTYLWTTFGAGLPVLAVVALVGAAWGAASGPIRWRS